MTSKKLVFIFVFQFLFFLPLFLYAEEAKDCYDCHKKEKEAFSKGTVHSPVDDEDCKACHEDHGDKNNLVLKFEVEKEICFTCHDKKGTKNYVHNPIRDGKCSICHNPHNSVNEHLLKSKVQELCLSCHKRNAKEQHLHTPYNEGKCLDCHDPHESNNRRLINLNSGKNIMVISDLCLECHQEISQGANVHLIVLAGECLSCHQQHSSKYKFQLVESLEKVCYLNCHEDLKENKYLHKPVKEGKCVSCHDPHNSPNSKLLLPKKYLGVFEEDKLCYLCHNNMKQKYSIKIHRPVRDGNCSSCHLPHGSKTENLLKYKDDKDMCLSCHTLSEYEDPINKKHSLDKVHTKCLECHNPHGN